MSEIGIVLSDCGTPLSVFNNLLGLFSRQQIRYFALHHTVRGFAQGDVIAGFQPPAGCAVVRLGSWKLLII